MLIYFFIEIILTRILHLWYLNNEFKTNQTFYEVSHLNCYIYTYIYIRSMLKLTFINTLEFVLYEICNKNIAALKNYIILK